MKKLLYSVAVVTSPLWITTVGLAFMAAYGLRSLAGGLARGAAASAFYSVRQLDRLRRYCDTAS